MPTALRRFHEHAAAPPEIDAVGVGRYTPEIEAAVYYCCLEAIQNATKHGGPGVHVSVAPAEEDGHLAFRVVDDGPGFAGRQVRGLGLQSMDDRLGALGGRLTIATAPRARHHDLRRGSPATGCAGAMTEASIAGRPAARAPRLSAARASRAAFGSERRSVERGPGAVRGEPVDDEDVQGEDAEPPEGIRRDEHELRDQVQRGDHHSGPPGELIADEDDATTSMTAANVIHPLATSMESGRSGPT